MHRWMGTAAVLVAVLLGGNCRAAYLTPNNCAQQPALTGAVTTSVGSCATTLATSGAAPSQQRFTSGSAQTYTTPANATTIVVWECGGGAGGGGSGATTGPVGTAGNSTTFNSVVASGGVSTASTTTGTTGGAGGVASSAGTGSATLRVESAPGAGGENANTVTEFRGGIGSNNYIGPASSQGGAGATTTSATLAGAGGGSAGECLMLRITSPAGTYTYTVGATAAGGIGTGTGAQTGAAGSAGIIVVDEYYAAAPSASSALVVAAAGSTQAGATALAPNTIYAVTSGTGGVALPVAVAGSSNAVCNQTTAQILVYPVNGGSAALGPIAANSPLALGAHKCQTFAATSATVWLLTVGECGSVGSAAAGTYDILCYGAIGNGVVDDTAAIQAAINAAELTVASYGGGSSTAASEIVIPCGNFLVHTGPLIIGATSTLVPNLVVQGNCGNGFQAVFPVCRRRPYYRCRNQCFASGWCIHQCVADRPAHLQCKSYSAGFRC